MSSHVPAGSFGTTIRTVIPAMQSSVTFYMCAGRQDRWANLEFVIWRPGGCKGEVPLRGGPLGQAGLLSLHALLCCLQALELEAGGLPDIPQLSGGACSRGERLRHVL